MADFSYLIAEIEAYVKQNGNNEITGNGLQDILVAMVGAIGGALNDAVSDLESADTTLTNAIGDEELARQGADNTLGGRITAEEEARAGADTGLQNQINGINGKIPDAASGTNKLADKAFVQGLVDALTASIAAINDKIPSEASSSNKLADKAFVQALTTALQNALNTLNGKVPAAATSENQLADKAFVTSLTTALQNAINAINTNIGNGFVYAGVATPSGTPVSGKVAYLTAQEGTYTNYGGLVVPAGISVIKYNGTNWSQEQVISMETIYRNPLMGLYDCDTSGSTAAKTVTAVGYVLPTNGGSMKVRMANHTTVDGVTLNINGTGAKDLYYKGKAAGINNTWDDGAVLNVIYDSTNDRYLAYNANAGTGDGVFDVSEYTGDDYATLEDAIADIPVSEQHGGMMMRFVRSSDNKYVQFRYMKSDAATAATFTNLLNWQSMNTDEVPTADSKNLMTSGGALGGIRNSRKNTIDLINNGVTNPFTVNSSERKLGSYTNKQQVSGVGEYTYNETNGYYIIPVSDFCGYNVSVDHATQYGLVSSYVEGEYIKYCDGCDRVTGVPTELTIPYDCNYLYLYVATNTSSVSVEIDGLPETSLKELKEAVAPISGMDARLESVETDLADLDEELFGSQVISSIDVSSTGTITFNPITLSQNGDELEVDVVVDSGITSLNLGGYPFTFGNTETKIVLAITTQRVCLRADDDTWLVPTTTAITSGKIKIKYNSGNIECYNNNTLISTYTGQKTCTIYGIGSQSMTSYGKFSGRINAFKYTHNGVTTDLWNLSGFTYNSGVTINRVTTGGVIPEIEEQISEIKEMPNVVVSATADAVTVHFRLNSKYYGVLPINHRVNHSDAVYQDLWGISGTDVNIGNIATYSNGQFTNINKCLLEGAENEFAIQFYSDDFTGGVHGDERIDVENDCYVVFIVDGKEYTISELIALGTIKCDSFAYRQKSALYTLYSVSSSHDILAYHVKRTEFKDGGYVTRNYVEMVQSIVAMNTYSGLACVNKDIANYCINNAGEIFTATHPTTAAKITDFVNNTSFEAKIYNGGGSCVCNSRVVGGNVSSFNTAPVKVSMFDRQYDLKYYAVMPQNVELTPSSVFEFECSVRFDYRDDS